MRDGVWSKAGWCLKHSPDPRPGSSTSRSAGTTRALEFAGPHRAASAMQQPARLTRLDKKICHLICPISAAMVGVCLTGVGLLRVAIAVDRKATLADDLLSLDAVIFLIATLVSYFALRTNARNHRLEQVADIAFIAAMVLLTAACLFITYSINL